MGTLVLGDSESMAALYVFPDTNLLMHFRRIDELDWTALSGATDIVVVLAPAVVKELGKHKDQHPSRKLRQRARNLNSWLRELRTRQDRHLKNGVTLEVATKEPTAFLMGDLDPAVNDDRIIANSTRSRARIPRQGGRGFHAKVGTDSTGWWAPSDLRG